MINKGLDIEKLMDLIADMQELSNSQDRLSCIISETLSSVTTDFGELDESDLELVHAAAMPSYQQFLKKYVKGCNSCE